MPYSNVPKNMTGKMDRCVDKVMKGGKSKSRAIAICHTSIMGKELDTDEMEVKEIIETYESTHDKETQEEKGMYYAVPYNITTFSDLAAYRQAQKDVDEITDLTYDFQRLVENIMTSGEVEDKISAIRWLTDEYETMLSTVSSKEAPGWVKALQLTVDRIKEKVYGGNPDEEDEEDEADEAKKELLIFKDKDGTYRWLARYSNNLRDNDNPSEIISAASHQRFVDLVDKEQAPYPELWLWHRPEWKLGVADWLAYDDQGFALAAGHFYKGNEKAAEWLSKQTDFAVSHGMPPSTIKRSPEDQSVIIEHQTREISFLPLSAAANKRTGFVVMTKEAEQMAIPQHKKDELLQRGWSADFLGTIETQDQQDAAKAADEGIESKETAPEQPAEETQPIEVEGGEEKPETEKAEVEQPAAVAEEPETDDEKEESPITREEIADAVGNVFKNYFEPVIERVGALEESLNETRKEIAQLRADDAEKIQKQLDETPAASLRALMVDRVVGKDAARVKESDGLKDRHPEEKEVEPGYAIGVPFLDKLMAE